MYRLWDWPDRVSEGEFVRLALEAGGIGYRDCAREGDDLLTDLQAPRAMAPFAPPYLLAGGETIGNASTILMFLGTSHDLAPRGVTARLWLNQAQVMVGAVAGTDPMDLGRAEAVLAWLEASLARRGPYLSGESRWCYLDLSVFEMVERLTDRFESFAEGLSMRYPRLSGVHARVGKLPELRPYLRRRVPLPHAGEGA